MNEAILYVILAVQSYKNFAYFDAKVHGVSALDSWQKTYEYYKGLPLPPGMNTSLSCFRDAMHYDVNEACEAQLAELHKFQWTYYWKKDE